MHTSQGLTCVGSGHKGLAVCRRRYAGVAQSVEQLICNQQVVGSSPVTSSLCTFIDFWILGGCPSGQRERAVNPPAFAYVGSNPAPPTFLRE
jgi:hypothetical protein